MDLTNMQISLSGHVGGGINGASTKLIKELKKAAAEAKGCPINRKAPTRITEDCFRRMCLKHQKRSGVWDTKNKTSIITNNGFRTNNKAICGMCKTGPSIWKNKRIRALPPGITIDEDSKAAYLKQKLIQAKLRKKSKREV